MTNAPDSSEDSYELHCGDAVGIIGGVSGNEDAITGHVVVNVHADDGEVIYAHLPAADLDPVIDIAPRSRVLPIPEEFLPE